MNTIVALATLSILLLTVGPWALAAQPGLSPDEAGVFVFRPSADPHYRPLICFDSAVTASGALHRPGPNDECRPFDDVRP